MSPLLISLSDTLVKKLGNSLNQEDENFLFAWPGRVQKKENEARPPNLPRGMESKALEIFLTMLPCPILVFYVTFSSVLHSSVFQWGGPVHLYGACRGGGAEGDCASRLWWGDPHLMGQL